VKRVSSYLLCFIALVLSGCFATSAHVDKSERLTLKLMTHILGDDGVAAPVLKEYSKHIEGGSGVQIDPTKLAPLADGLVPGLGGLVTLGVTLYARKKQLEAQHATKEAVIAAKEPDKEKALNRLAADDKIKGYNG
jgi:hypothetical protein